MNLEMAVDIFQRMITHAILLVSPIMVTAIFTGVLVSLLQSVTSIQEQTLTFVPKLVAVGLVLIISANWLIRSMVEFTITFFERLPGMAP